jgi:drug/metabolite transporter (DMT)-like permease
MSEPAATPAPSDVSPHADAPIDPRSDLADGLGWIALGVAVLIGSVTMDRLERQHINPYTVPGLLPGLLGIAMILLGGILSLRSWRRGALRQAAAPQSPFAREERRRIWVVTGLCVGYAALLVGHGLPFWLASAIYVTGSILVLQRLARDEHERRLTPRLWLKALVIGLGAGAVTTLVFQELFLVRLP